MPWGAVIGAVGAIGGAAINSSAAGANAQAAQNIANQDLSYTSPYNTTSGFGTTNFTSNGYGNTASGQLTPQYQGLENGFLGTSAGFLGALNQMGGSNGISPFLANAYGQYQNSLPNPYGAGFGSLGNQAFGSNLGTAGAFGNAATGMLGSLAGYNPQAAGQQYSNLLAQQSAPANALATQNLAQSLYNSGGLGSTGGANALTALGNMQNNQWVGQQLAGQQLGMQNQSLMGGLASQFGGLNTSMNANNFNMGSSLNSSLYGRQYSTAQQGFQNAIGLNQAGIQNLGAYGGLGTSMLGSGMNIDSSMLSQMQAAAGMGAERTGAATTAGNTALQGMLAQNNTNAAGLNGIISGLTNANWGGLFGGASSTATQGGSLTNNPMAY